MAHGLVIKAKIVALSLGMETRELFRLCGKRKRRSSTLRRHVFQPSKHEIRIAQLLTTGITTGGNSSAVGYNYRL